MNDKQPNSPTGPPDTTDRSSGPAGPLARERSSSVGPGFGRYDRQVRYQPFGEAGQRALANSTVAIAGCGALGSVQASILARAGVGELRLIDRDFLEINNLQRQVVFDERDVESGLPKAEAAARKLRAVNSDIRILSFVEDLNHRNIERLCENVSLILDGTDNFETRFLINDYSIAKKIPWIYGGAIGCDGQSMTILPGETPCLRCLMLDGPPPPGTTESCDTAGVLAPITQVIASFQCSETLKILSGQTERVNRKLLSIELWENQCRWFDLSTLKSEIECPVCDLGQFIWLEGTQSSQSAVLCGRNAVQLSPSAEMNLDLAGLEEKLARFGSVHRNPFLLQLQADECMMTVFPNGRAIIKGTEDIGKARSLYSRWIGN